jgi:ribosome biogenesis GTPase
MKATVVGIYGAYYEVRPHDYSDRVILAKIRGKLRLSEKNSSYFHIHERHLLTIGDDVKIQYSGENESEAYILEVFPRKNSFQRATVNQKQTLGANLDAVIIFSSLDFPPFNNGLLTRLIIEADLSKISSIVVLNKMDYYETEKKELYEMVLEKVRYLQGIHIKVYFETIVKGISKELKNEIKKGRFLAFGESGVGKSSFINQMMGKKVQVVDPDEIGLKGRHITTNPVMYELQGGIELIDIPGIREFGLMHRSPLEISGSFPEFDGLKCKYVNCLHINEPDCAIKENVSCQKIPEFRYNEYANIVKSMGEKWKPRRGDYRLPTT